MATAALSAAAFAPALARPRRARAACVASAAKPDAKKQGWTEKATVGGGGFSGACDIEVRAWNGRAVSSAGRRAGRPAQNGGWAMKSNSCCASQVAKQALDECAGLEGERLKACWASNGACAGAGACSSPS
jgi:hypothetical protein